MDEVKTDPNVKAAIEEMQRVLGTRVRIVEKAKKKGGRIEIEYYSRDDLDRIYDSFADSSNSISALLQHRENIRPAPCGFRVTGRSQNNSC